jgi:hypothetical protein
VRSKRFVRFTEMLKKVARDFYRRPQDPAIIFICRRVRAKDDGQRRSAFATDRPDFDRAACGQNHAVRPHTLPLRTRAVRNSTRRGTAAPARQSTVDGCGGGRRCVPAEKN